VSAAGAPRTRSDAGAPRSRSAACRSILDSVSAEVLREIAADHLDLVCGSTAIHERDGAVAMGIVTSGWCQLLREASRQPAGDHRCASTPASTLRRCPEACCNEVARLTMETGQPVDAQCPGGLSLHAVPIRAGEEIVGAISISYGTPPSDEDALCELAAQFAIPVTELRGASEAHPVPLPGNVASTKRRLHTSARLIGEMVWRRRALQSAHRLQELTTALARALTAADVGAAVVEEALYALGGSFGALTTLASDGLRVETQYARGMPPRVEAVWRSVPLSARAPAADAIRSGRVLTFESSAALTEAYPVVASLGVVPGALAAVPLLLDGRAIGALTVGFHQPHAFSEGERAFMAIVAGHCALALERARLFDAERTLRERAECAAAERALAEQRFRLALASSPITVSTVDRDLRYTWVYNPQVASAEEYLGRRDDEIADYGDVSELIALKRDVLESGARVRREIAVRRSDGEVRYLDVTAEPLRENGVVTGVTVAAADLTERRLAEEALRRAKEEADAANRAKSDFLAVVSHELRTPLTAIIAYQDLIGSGVPGPLTDRQREYLGRIRSSAWHLLELISQLLGASRIETGREELEIVPVTPSVLAREAVSYAMPGATAKQLRLRIELPPGADLPFRSDPRKLRQILVNLLDNAVKYTAHGEVVLRIERPGDAVRFHVIDTGIGIPPEQLRRIFEPFTQVEVCDTRRNGGIGLGLAVAQRLARLLGGDLSVESRPGVGSRFTLWIPA